ncbi:hypothetical protein GF362_02715 [Candidatus Dojkabacteria bacterium]|nr:hypothetical protein [Candidatus Dojkabacteria bacterium]
MYIYLKAGQIKDLSRVYATGLIDGIDTEYFHTDNKTSYKDHIKSILKEIDLPITIQNNAYEFDDIISESKKLAKVAKDTVIKMNLSENTIKAAQVLEHQKINTCITSIQNVSQATLAAKAGIQNITISVTDIKNKQIDFDIIEAICRAYDIYGFQTKIGIDEVTNIAQLNNAFKIGVDYIVLSTHLFWQIFDPIQNRPRKQIENFKFELE